MIINKIYSMQETKFKFFYMISLFCKANLFCLPYEYQYNFFFIILRYSDYLYMIANF